MVFAFVCRRSVTPERGIAEGFAGAREDPEA